NGGIGTAGPAAEPAGQQAPGNASAAPPTATATPAPTAVPVPTATPAAPLRPINVLLLGLDRRPGETEISRSDSLMIIHIDPLSPSLALLSLPRDLWVTLPGTEQWVKINAAYSHGEEAGGPAGGAQAAKATIEQVIAQPIDYTLVTTFEGMIGMVDAIGGIDINVPQALVDTSFPNFDYSTMTAQFEAGPQPMDGFWALVYSRTRHPDSDFQRIRRQQLVLLAMFARLQGLADAGQPPELATLAARLQGSFEYSDLDPAEALRLAGALDGLDLAGVRREAIDLRYGAETSTIDGAYIIMPDTAAIQRVAAELFGN
ncbi:MAG TPA: LCP family protein, partial [Herpetosiphonaceae bacterium]